MGLLHLARLRTFSTVTHQTGFWCIRCDETLHVEDFEDELVDAFLTIDNGQILEPNAISGLPDPVTDSVDGDDGLVDGNGNGGHSWFTGASNDDDDALTITFNSSVTSAGLVFTDGDILSTNISLEAFAVNGSRLD